MKINQKRLFTTLSLFSLLALMPMGCNLFCHNSCGCGPIPEPYLLAVQSFATETVDETGTETPETEMKPFDQVFKSLRIEEYELHTQSMIESPGFSSFGTALACDPLPPETEDILYLIQIINQTEFTLIDGTTFSEGDNISALFGMSHLYAPGLSTIKNFMAPGLKLTVEDYFKIGFLENPEKELNLKFTIQLVFDNAREHLLTDQVLNVRQP